MPRSPANWYSTRLMNVVEQVDDVAREHSPTPSSP